MAIDAASPPLYGKPDAQLGSVSPSVLFALCVFYCVRLYAEQIRAAATDAPAAASFSPAIAKAGIIRSPRKVRPN